MKSFKKMIALGVMCVFVASSFGNTQLNAAQYCADVAGCGYEECRSSPCLTPAIALGAIALVAIIAVAVQNSGKGHSSHNKVSASN